MPPLSHLKLTRLAELEGFRTKEAPLHAYISEITVPGICMDLGCDTTPWSHSTNGKGTANAKVLQASKAVWSSPASCEPSFPGRSG